jgi:2-keto-4-pentenoate hydratase
VEHAFGISGPVTLAKCRRGGTASLLPLDKLASRAEAEAFQAAAVSALGGVPCGYKIGATSVEVQRLLSCHEPIYSPILSEDVLQNGSTFRIPRGLLGVECEFGFVMGRDFQHQSGHRTSPRCGRPLRNALSASNSWAGAWLLTCLSTK